MPEYEPSKRRLTWKNGSYATLYSGDKPGQLRGPNNQAAWVDELAKFQYPQESWDQLKYTLRKGVLPQVLITTTPRPIPIIKSLIAHKRTIMTGGSTFENMENLSNEWLHDMLNTYAGTTLGQQELYAALLDESKGALWSRAMLDASRVGSPDRPAPEKYRRTAIGVDPATTSNRESAMTGIVVVSEGFDKHGYVRGDASGRYKPVEWARRVCELFLEFDADEIVVEGNQGGEMTRHTIHSYDSEEIPKKVASKMPVRIVHARRSKQARAEPVTLLYEQGRMHHVGMFAGLEDQMVTWEPESGQESPDRVDALVWAARRLFVAQHGNTGVSGPILFE